MIPLIILAAIVVSLIIIVSVFNSKVNSDDNTFQYRSNFIEFEATKYILTKYKDVTFSFRYGHMPDPYRCVGIVIGKGDRNFMVTIEAHIQDRANIPYLHKYIDRCVHELNIQTSNSSVQT